MSDTVGSKNGSDPPEPLDAGLKAALGPGSVLESLAPMLGDRGKVLLREEESGQGSPVIDPRAAEAAGLTLGRGNYQLLGEIARLDQSVSPLILGTIYTANQPSLRSALSVGRRDAGGWVTLSAPPS